MHGCDSEMKLVEIQQKDSCKFNIDVTDWSMKIISWKHLLKHILWNISIQLGSIRFSQRHI